MDLLKALWRCSPSRTKLYRLPLRRSAVASFSVLAVEISYRVRERKETLPCERDIMLPRIYLQGGAESLHVQNTSSLTLMVDRRIKQCGAAAVTIPAAHLPGHAGCVAGFDCARGEFSSKSAVDTPSNPWQSCKCCIHCRWRQILRRAQEARELLVDARCFLQNYTSDWSHAYDYKLQNLATTSFRIWRKYYHSTTKSTVDKNARVSPGEGVPSAMKCHPMRRILRAIAGNGLSLQEPALDLCCCL